VSASRSLWSELRRRKVFRVAVVYAATAFVVLQAADIMLPRMGIPDWGVGLVVALAVLGFPIALVLAWALELTPEGIKRTDNVSVGETQAAAAPALLGKRTVFAASLLVVLGIGLGAGWFLKPAPPGDVELRGGSDEARPSLAVLPFKNLSADAEQGYFADGLTEEILNALAALPKLLVTARTSSFFYKDKNVPVDEIAERLGVEHILEGSVRRSGEQMRVAAQLIRAGDGFRIWSNTYDRSVDDAFAVQSDIAAQVASALGILLDEEQRALMRAAGVNNPEAYAFYARGEELFRLAHGSLPQIETLVRANREYDRATTAAPELWAASYASADLYSHVLLELAAGGRLEDMPEGVGDDPAGALQRRLDAAMRHAPTQAARDSIELTRRVFSDDWTGLADLVRRIYRDPEPCGFDQWAHAVGLAFGAAQQAAQYYARSVQCNRLDGGSWTMASTAALYAGDPARSLAIIEEGRGVYVATLREEVARLRALMANGHMAEARAGLPRLSGSDNLRASMDGELAAMAGDRARALAARDRLLPETARDPDVFDAGLRLSAKAGDREAANAIAAAIDARPGGQMLLLGTTYFCRCGAPFDLETTPILAARLEEAGITWPPVSPLDWPLKDW
jgi:adenylate cyclase